MTADSHIFCCDGENMSSNNTTRIRLGLPIYPHVNWLIHKWGARGGAWDLWFENNQVWPRGIVFATPNHKIMFDIVWHKDIVNDE